MAADPGAVLSIPDGLVADERRADGRNEAEGREGRYHPRDGEQAKQQDRRDRSSPSEATADPQTQREMRLKHQQPDGFTIYASKTIAVPIDVLFDAFVNPRSRRKWLTDGTMSLRTSQPGHTARFNWGDGSTRLNVSFDDKGPAKPAVAVAHERLRDADEAETTKLSWRERLSDLKSFLES
jgi:uncharacterized protein YndB with AHSA1/START domain